MTGREGSLIRTLYITALGHATLNEIHQREEEEHRRRMVAQVFGQPWPRVSEVVSNTRRNGADHA